MKKNGISIVCSSQHDLTTHKKHLINTSGFRNNIEFLGYKNNGEFSLTEIYNRGLLEAKYNIVVFIHHDIIMNTNGWGRKLLKQFDTTDYGILGLAGTTNLSETGRWWDDRAKMVGIVKHSDNGHTWESKYSGNFSDKIIETLLVDGLFLAIHKDRIWNTFDETVEGFHFYEVDFCFRNHLSGTKIGVLFNIKVTHKSVGRTNDQWEANRLLFAEKYKDSLPASIDVVPFSYDKEIILKSEPKVKIILSVGEDVEKTKRFITMIEDSGYSNYEISLVVDEDLVESVEELHSDKVASYKSNFSVIHKSLSVLRWDEDFANENDELVMFASDDMVFDSNVLKKFVSVYNKNNNRLGCIFPRILNNDKTIVSSGVVVTAMIDGDKQMLTYMLKGINSYYNYQEGMTSEVMGNLGFCFMTTYENLVTNDWFRLDFENGLYEVDFAAKCAANGKTNFVDNDSVVRLDDNFSADLDNIKELDKDFGVLIKSFNESPKMQKLVKITRVPKAPVA